ncbi:MAG: hypothetical protein P5702_18625 [Limnospira sp. PMC 1291.21]|uniref:Uncharacterized protein n=3 Tax=Limnospira TaxID=2596745 RepID=A0A9P1P0L0_9CYAN|nr:MULTISPECIES: hypothetical protein [Limnospira]EKD07633.1 hypothetical protein SPLC1_S370090 [Arthrospira platensis C1]MDC0836196.1 hypothetical protein [Limnoraphis robusta]MDY7054699.1 hypothetical protein [Limnospira fusiformis LS22]QJB25575.1 hypothetical protein HFV01_06960 [Limnospira fusiformis SAG 85.79]EDZ96362.1 hypothetical protein AmaxDRAFT_1028 [Limnospira maxima CS-328]
MVQERVNPIVTIGDRSSVRPPKPITLPNNLESGYSVTHPDENRYKQATI